jgi:hypothetical protein
LQYSQRLLTKNAPVVDRKQKYSKIFLKEFKKFPMIKQMSAYFLPVAGFLLITIACPAMAQEPMGAPVPGYIAEDSQVQKDIKDKAISSKIAGGSYIFKPSIKITEEYDDNIYTEDGVETDDFITKISPRLEVDAAPGSAHRLDFHAGLTQALYVDHSDDNYLDYNAGVKGRYKFDSTCSLGGMADYRQLHSSRGDDQADPDSNASEPIPYEVWRGNGSLSKKIKGFKLVPRLGWERYEFENVNDISGAPITQDFRDRDEYEIGGRFGYGFRDHFEFFTDLQLAPRDYDASGASRRDSDGGDYLAGISYRPEKAIHFEAAAGYMNRAYDAAVYDDINDIGALVRWEWNFAEDSRLKLGFRRYIGEVTDTGVGGTVRSDFQASVVKKLVSDLKGKLEGRFINSYYKGGNGSSSGASDRKDNYYKASAGLSYELAPQTALTADYSYARNNSNRNSSDYDQNIFMLGLKHEFWKQD